MKCLSLLAALCLVTLVTGCGRGLESRPPGTELQTTIDAVTLESLITAPWRLGETTDANPFNAGLAAGDALVFRFRNDYSGDAKILRAGGATEPWLAFRWAVDLGAMYLSVRFENGVLADFWLQKIDGGLRFTDATNGALVYDFAPQP